MQAREELTRKSPDKEAWEVLQIRMVSALYTEFQRVAALLLALLSLTMPQTTDPRFCSETCPCASLPIFMGNPLLQ